MTKVGDKRYIAMHIDSERASAVARHNGWDGNPESLLDYCDTGMAAATYTEHCTLDAACAVARAELAKGRSLFGAVIIDHEIFEQAHDDRGRTVKGGSWETHETYEVGTDGECISVAA